MLLSPEDVKIIASKESLAVGTPIRAQSRFREAAAVISASLRTNHDKWSCERHRDFH